MRWFVSVLSWNVASFLTHTSFWRSRNQSLWLHHWTVNTKYFPHFALRKLELRTATLAEHMYGRLHVLFSYDECRMLSNHIKRTCDVVQTVQVHVTTGISTGYKSLPTTGLTSCELNEPLKKTTSTFLRYSALNLEVRGGEICWGTALQAGRMRIRFPMGSLT
jgi:hypothetical protein